MGSEKLIIPLAVAYNFPYQLIVGPALVIVLATVLLLLLRFPSAKSKASAFLVFAGLIEVVGTLMVAFLWGFLFSIFTLVIGIVLGASTVTWNKKSFSKPVLPIALILLGAVSLAAAIRTSFFPIFRVGLSSLIVGLVLGSVQLAMSVKNPTLKKEIDVVLILVAVLVTTLVTPMAFAWGLIFGLSILATGILIGLSALYPWLKVRLTEGRKHTLKKAIYTLLALVIVVSASLIMIRASTNLIHEQWLENGPRGVTPNLTIRGTVASVAFNVEVNTGYSYHIFPAIITLDNMELVAKSDNLPAPIVPDQLLIGGSMTVYIEGDNIAPLRVGSVVEAKGYWTPWMEDSLYSGKFVVGPAIFGSYIESVPPSSSQAELANTGYLKLPSVPTVDRGISKLFLVSATSSKGIRNGQECYIINATIRNDYSAQQPPSDSIEGSDQVGEVYFILHANLYANGEQVAAPEVTEPRTMPVPGSPQRFLEAGQTGWFEMDLATSNRRVDSFRISLVAVGGVPIP